MEGSYWLRLGSIIAMVLGCIYVLLPSMLDDSNNQPNVATAVEKSEPALEVWFTSEDKRPDEANASVLEKRLRAFDVDIERVEAGDDKVTVHLRSSAAKGAKTKVIAAASQPGASAIYPLESVAGVDLAAWKAAADPAAELGRQLGGKKVEGASPVAGVALRGAATQPDGKLLATLDGALAAPAVVAIDGRAVGVVEPGEAGAVISLAPSDVQAGLDAALLAAPALPEPLKRVEAPKAAEKKGEEVQKELTWWEGLLPNTKLNLGLDLQGGIDLTLQVDQEAAVFAQVQRDRNVLRDQAARDNKAIDVLRDRSRPALKVAAAEDLASLKDWLSGVLRQYTYTETISEEGKTYHVFLMQEVRDEEIRAQAVEQVLETLRKRVDSTGVKEPAIVKMPGGRINIQLPGVSDAQAAVDALGQQAQLEFRLVDAKADGVMVRDMIDEAKKELAEEVFNDDDLLNEWLHEKRKLAEDRALLWEYDENEAGELVRSRPIQLHDQVVLTGGDVNNAGVGWDQSNQPQVLLEFKPQGARVFCDITTANIDKQFAIILDHQIRSAPVIRSAICGGSASIEMGGSADPMKDANTLALVLRTGSLTAPVDVGEVRQVGPSLGADAIRSGILGSLVGGGITILFMLVWYRTAGFIANIALLINMLLVFALLAMFGATLTLPGIAGVALTVGMAIDANIIVYERIREELALGVSARKAVDTGYDKGVTAVIDANLTAAIAGVVLYSYGAGPIKGFAVTLLIGIFTTVVSGVYVTRTLLEIVTRNSNARLDI